MRSRARSWRSSPPTRSRSRRSRSSRTSAATTRSGLQTFFGQAFKKLGGDDRRRAVLQPGRLGLPGAADADQGREPRGDLRPGLLHRGRHDRRARRASSASRCRSSAATAGTRRSSGRSAARRSNGCYFSNHYSTDDPNPVVQKFVNDYKAKFGSCPTRSPLWATTRRRSSRTRSSARGLDRRRQGARRARGHEGLPGRDRQRSRSTRSATPSSRP